MVDEEKPMNKYQEDPAIVEIGELLASKVPGMYGKISFNFWKGNYVSYNITYGPKPRKVEKNSSDKKP